MVKIYDPTSCEDRFCELALIDLKMMVGTIIYDRCEASDEQSTANFIAKEYDGEDWGELFRNLVELSETDKRITYVDLDDADDATLAEYGYFAESSDSRRRHFGLNGRQLGVV